MQEYVGLNPHADSAVHKPLHDRSAPGASRSAHVLGCANIKEEEEFYRLPSCNKK